MNEKTRPSTFTRGLSGLLIVLSLAGFAASIHANLKLAGLRQTRADLRKQVGRLEVDDPNRVVIGWVPSSDDLVPPGVDEAHVWRFRIHFPLNYGRCIDSRQDRVAADSPRGSGGSTTSWSSPGKSEEVLASIAIIRSGEQWMICRTIGGSGGVSSLPGDFRIESMDELVLETVVDESTPTRSFAVDEAICLFRLREKQSTKDRRGDSNETLYRGIATYLYESKQNDAFRAWADGKADSLKEAAKILAEGGSL